MNKKKAAQKDQEALDSSADRDNEEEENDDEKESFPPKVMKRIEYLEKLHDVDIAEIDVQYKKERAQLEEKYLQLKKAIYEQRRLVIAGDFEAPANDTEPVNDADKKAVEEDNSKGIPGFWFRALANHQSIGDFITEEDVPALEALTDITVSYNESYSSFTIVFHFSENPYFTNTTLEKTYQLTPDILEEKSPTLTGSSGTVIQWKQFKDLTVTEVKKKQKAKSGKNKGQIRTVTRLEPKPSFFHYFSDPVDYDEEEADDEDQNARVKMSTEEDYDIAHALRTEIVPDAVEWFTGAAVPDDDEFDGEEEEDEDEEEDDDDDDDDDGEEEERKKKPTKGKTGKPGKGLSGSSATSGDEQKECKAQ